VNVKTKKQSKQWRHMHSPNNPKKLKQTFACQKADGNCFLGQNRKGVVMVEFMQRGTTITSEVHCETLRNCLEPAIQNKRHGMLTSCVMLLHDDACPHTVAPSRTLLEHFNWELFDHPPDSPDLVPNDYHLFTYLKNWFGSQHLTIMS
jgi:hypothetical protein